VEYLSDVPTVERSDIWTLSASEDPAGQTNLANVGDLDPTRATSGLGFSDLVNFGFSARYTASF